MKTANKTVLLVDDDCDIMWGVGRCLARAGFSVTTCADGGEAVSVLLNKSFDVLVTDVRMPILNGLGLVDWVRVNRARMKIVVMTGFGSPSIRRMSLGKGAMLYLEKPIDPDILIDALLTMDNSSAFSGSIDEIDILDYLQLLILSGRQVILDVHGADGAHGQVFISKGDILHAICGALGGEEALYRCVSFKGGSFSNLPWTEEHETTINKPAEFLLIEAARVRDEARFENEQPHSRPGLI
jgi:ActR/RegA family two-component response regulator